MTQYRLKIGSWNIQGGVGRKVCSGELQTLISGYDIYCLQETWLTCAESINVPGYHIHRSDRKKKDRARKGSGGVITLFKHSIQKGITKIPSSNKDCLWARLDKTFFGLKTDLYICNAYVVPRDSPYFIQGEKDVIDILREEINQYATKGDVMIIGDLNARIGERQEHIDMEVDEEATGLNQGDIQAVGSDSNTLLERCSKDKKVNDSGRSLLTLMSATHLVALNGRCTGDLNGEFTYDCLTGSSVIDMCLISIPLLPRLAYFKIEQPNALSDHRSICACIKI